MKLLSVWKTIQKGYDRCDWITNITTESTLKMAPHNQNASATVAQLSD